MDFRLCVCDGDYPHHGYFTKNGEMIHVPIMSVRAARLFIEMDTDDYFAGIDIEALLAKVQATGLPERAEFDIEAVEIYSNMGVIISEVTKPEVLN